MYKCNFFHMLIIARVTCTASSEAFWFWFQSKKKLSLGRALNFQIHLGIHKKNAPEINILLFVS